MPCKTRQAALRGERSKPHYYLNCPASRRFVFETAHNYALHDDKAEQALQAFEARIDWSTWGRSRFRLRASAPRTSATERTGWPTPKAGDDKMARTFIAGRATRAIGSVRTGSYA